MDTSGLNRFAQSARIELLEQIGSKLSSVLTPESPARREYPSVVNELEKVLAKLGKEGLIDQVAYTWFNRFCALRFMDVNGYNRVGVVSPVEGQVQPEILAEAKSGVLDVEQLSQKTQDQIRGLLGGSIPSTDAQGEAYRLLIVGSCNALYERLPYLFERISDYTELLMPDDLLSESSILAKTRAAMTPESCQDVEIIGWLYQFYIAEKKDAVFEGLKKNQKITPENIPAATQLFTPHWIVQYLVENSLGRLWILNRPASKLNERMEYYIAPEKAESDFLEVSSPTELRVCDPAVGSGHMLTYAFDLLYAIYEEEGYDSNDIPGLILTHNLYGIEIDDRAGALASFALDMKAAKRLGRRRFFRMDVKPQICVLENVIFEQSEMDDVVSIVGRDLYTADLRETLTQFEHAKNFGSLIVPQLKDPTETARLVEIKDLSGDLLLSHVHQRLLKVLEMSEYLSCRYHVVLANPPYMGGKGFNGVLARFAKDNYPDSKSDLFAMFIERGMGLIPRLSYNAMVTMQSWMFLSSYEKLRINLETSSSIECMVHMANMVMGIAFGTNGAVWQKGGSSSKRGGYCYVQYDNIGDDGCPNEFPPHNERNSKAPDGRLYRQSVEDFRKIPGSPVAYWISNKLSDNFIRGTMLRDLARPCQGMATTNNGLFVRDWHEVSISNLGTNQGSQESAAASGFKWFPYNKGGEGRRWFGNHDDIVNFENNGKTICDYIDNTPGASVGSNGRVINRERFFKESISWSKISSGKISLRSYPPGFIFDVAGCSIFADHSQLMNYCGFMNSIVCLEYLGCMSPTLNFEVGQINKLPIIELDGNAKNRSKVVSETLIHISRNDWNTYEKSWGFTCLPLLNSDYHDNGICETYTRIRKYWQAMTGEMQRLEEENNRIFIEAYGLQDELTPDVPIEEITLTCNPAYRYGIKGTEEEREARLKADTMAEFLSYAVGCMFGRYSLDEPGLILANQGETLADYLARIPEPMFMPDDDNVIPIIDLDGDWFEDDISERFKQFLRVTFGEENYSQNLAFIEDALGKSVQKYFVKDFYADHVQRYKKRPIYWLFTSPKGTFNALIYMHRYTPSTVSVVLNEYLREFRTKLEARRDSYDQISISMSASEKEKTQALKMIDKLDKALTEVNDYERDVLYPLAGKNIAIDLDDGVKQNYPLFGSALTKIAGLS
ncbi:MAG: BREX-1 system adenine-specific DNA-methyltransferase PglX [Betaproteobacteria bacterium]